MASPFATTQASSLTRDLAVNSLLAPFGRRAPVSWAGSTNAPHTWPSIPWAADAIGPTNLCVPNEGCKPGKAFYLAALNIYSSLSFPCFFRHFFVPSSFSDSRF